jgi:3-hydroxyacyl-CoA dehydrogenase/enoyl-CoA hydratase/3-hydroxybutyryl-CoA epimerase
MKNLKVNYTDHDSIKVITIDCPDKTVNILSEEVLRELGQLLDDTFSETSLLGLIIKSAKADFIVGADINDITRMKHAQEAREGSLAMQGILNKITLLRVPSIALIHGQCLGGGLELALTCTYRLASTDPKTLFGFPEIQLGLIPGAGGTQRTPRLIGIAAALDLLLSGKRINSKKAFSLGLIHETVDAAQLEEMAVALLKNERHLTSHQQPLIKKGLQLALEKTGVGREFIKKKALQTVKEKTKGFYPAAPKLIETVFSGLSGSLAEGLNKEAAAFGELRETSQASSLIHLFHATTASKKNPSEAGLSPMDTSLKPVETVGIYGAGLMGSGIATVLADKGVRSLISDPSVVALGKAKEYAHGYFSKLVKRRKIKNFEASRKLAHVSLATSPCGFMHCDAVIEAVFENIDLKQKILEEFEKYCKKGQFFASNTSAIPIKKIAEKSKFPQNVIGLHFFSPVEKMPLIEIVKTSQTAPWVINQAISIAKKMGKQMILVNDGPGFYTTRILAFYLVEALLMVAEGNAIEGVDEALTSAGFPVGPITLIDEVGIDVGIHIVSNMSQSFPDRISVPENFKPLIESSRQGRKNGSGFYKYQANTKLGPDETIYPLIRKPGTPLKPSSREEIVERCVLAFIAEAVRCLEDGILEHPYDGDVGAVFGLGFPPFWGGPFKYIDQCSISNILARMESLEQKCGARFAAPTLLRSYFSQNKPFFPDE